MVELLILMVKTVMDDNGNWIIDNPNNPPRNHALIGETHLWNHTMRVWDGITMFILMFAVFI